MLSRKILFTLTLSGSFCASFLVGMNCKSSRVADLHDEVKQRNNNPPLRTKTRETEKNSASSSTEQKTLNMVILMQKLEKKLSIEELNSLFDAEVTGDELSKQVQREIMKRLVIKKWGELAPKQCLEKLETTKGGKDYLPSLFSGWASKNPEAALAFYEEYYKGEKSQYSTDTLNTIIREYAKHSPEKAWSWLETHEKDISKKAFQENKLSFLTAISQKNPELIPQYIAKVDMDKNSSEAYSIGVNWGNHNSEPAEWINSLTGESKFSAEAGRIMGITKGNLEKMNDIIRELPAADQGMVIKNLAQKVLNNGGLDIPERVNWIMDSLPPSEIYKEVQFTIETWMREDRKDAKAWLDTLPDGEKKELLMNSYNRNGFLKF